MHIFSNKVQSDLPSPGVYPDSFSSSKWLSFYAGSGTAHHTQWRRRHGNCHEQRLPISHYPLNELTRNWKVLAYIPVLKGKYHETGYNFFHPYTETTERSTGTGNGLYMNGDFTAVQQYILDRRSLDGHIRFFAGYAGWSHGRLQQEIQRNSWFIGKGNSERLLHDPQKVLLE